MNIRSWTAAGLAAVLISATFAAGAASTASAATVNIAQGKHAWASSAENPSFVATRATDGDTSTRWASEFSDAQWIEVDLGSTAVIESVELVWEAAYGKTFAVQTSDDGANWTTVANVTDGSGGTQTVLAAATARYLRLDLAQRGTGYGYSLWELRVLGSGGTAPDPYTPKPLPPAPPGADTTVTHHEFQMNCTFDHGSYDDPIVFPGQPGASHHHTFMGNYDTDAFSTPESLLNGSGTSCTVPQDKSGYWVPSVIKNGQPVTSDYLQTIYYKAGILDYTQVRAFPAGLRFLVGDMMATPDEFRDAVGTVEGFECGDSVYNWDFNGLVCPAGSQLNIRYQAPSCWNGIDLDSANHKSHMAYPVNGVCPSSHPVPVPMIEVKLAWPVDGDLSAIDLATMMGASSFHFDFMNGWDQGVLGALVEHCINGGLQCNPQGFDLYKPWAGGVLDDNYQLID